MGEDMQDCMQTGDILYGRPPGCPEHISLLLNREQRFYFTIYKSAEFLLLCWCRLLRRNVL